MTLEQLREKIMVALDDQHDDDLVSLWNEYTNYNNDPDSYIYSMNEFNDLFSGTDCCQLVRMCFYGGFNPDHDWFWFNGYGNLSSSDFPEDHIDNDCIADMIIDTMDSYNNYDIQLLLDEWEEQEAEEEE